MGKALIDCGSRPSHPLSQLYWKQTQLKFVEASGQSLTNDKTSALNKERPGKRIVLLYGIN